jgi:hypothetical protein
MRTLVIWALSLSLGLFAAAPGQAAQQEPAYDNPVSPVDLLSSYYSAINHQDYQKAYSYWENPPQSYGAFVRGFANTVSAQLIVQPPTWIDGAAGSLYAQIPAVVIATHNNGTQHMCGISITPILPRCRSQAQFPPSWRKPARPEGDRTRVRPPKRALIQRPSSRWVYWRHCEPAARECP